MENDVASGKCESSVVWCVCCHVRTVILIGDTDSVLFSCFAVVAASLLLALNGIFFSSGWTVTRTCNNSRAMEECTVTNLHQKAVVDMVPEVTALAEARVPDITTKVLIWKEIKKREVSSVLR